MSEPAAATMERDDPVERSSSDGGVKETIESIIVAFILAFIFRGFIVEAFVIPTGSMAPTLLGAHMRFHCPDCGYKFDVNYQNESNDPDDVNVPKYAVIQSNAGTTDRTYSINCPNCGYKIPRNDPADSNNDATAPPVRYGDRILVLKYLYLFEEPQRWDVVVFKAPATPARFDYSQNYIKRLVGRPGEAVMILDGDVYVGKSDGSLDDYVVQTKPRIVQEALWRIVADNDYLPQGLVREETNVYGQVTRPLPPWQQPWTAVEGQAGWTLSGRTFTFDNSSGAATIYFDAGANQEKRALTDWLAYDSTWDSAGGRAAADAYAHAPPQEPAANVSDIKVDFYYERTAGEGPLHVQITKLDDAFTAQITPVGATLYMRRGKGDGVGEPVAPTASIHPKLGKPVHVELINCDYRVTLRIDGADIASTTPEQYHPDIHALMEKFKAGPGQKWPKPEIRISAERQSARFSHISLWRDIYYLNRGTERRDQMNHARTAWASPESFDDNVMKLGKDEYFVLGDNSLISGDARTWDDPINLPEESLDIQSGRVPKRFLLGKAFFVYWPAGYRPIESAPALAPNFGDMRFIH